MAFSTRFNSACWSAIAAVMDRAGNEFLAGSGLPGDEHGCIGAQAAGRDLEQRAREGHFRDDLYYRLAVVPLQVPRCASAATISRYSASIS